MGYAPHIEDVEAEAAPGGRGLPGRPHSALAAGAGSVGAGLAHRVVLQVRARPTGDGAGRRGHVSPSSVRTYPDSPLGWAGAGDLHLQLADEAEQLGQQPFQVRVVAAGGAGGVRRGATPLGRPGAPGRAGAGRCRPTATTTMPSRRWRRLSERLPWQPVHQTVLVAALERADRPDDVVETIEETPQLDRPDDGQPVAEPAPGRDRRARLAELRVRRQPRRVGVRPVPEVRRRLQRAGPRLRAGQQRHLGRVLVPRGHLRRCAAPESAAPTTPGS